MMSTDPAPTAGQAGRRPAGRPRSQASHDAILNATLTLLAEVGYAAMSIEEVAARAGTGKTTIYRRWPSKLELTLAAFEKLPEIVPSHAGPIEEDLRIIVHRFIRLMETTPLGRVLPSLLGAGARSPELLAQITPMLDLRREPARGAIRQAVARGELVAATNVELLIDCVMGPVMMRMFLDGSPSSAAFVSKVVDHAIAPYRAGQNDGSK